MIFLLLLTISNAQINGLPSIVNQYVQRFRTDFDVRDANRQDYRPLLANVVRLAFHYCVGDSGCDGCINMGQPDNAGLELSVNYLEPLVNDWMSAGLSKADLYALASMVAANMALGNAGWASDLSNFEIGRTDCSDPTVEEVFPDAHEEPFTFFSENFGFSARDTTVIMGAHTLGRALTGNSGFENFWADNALPLGNGFYEAIERNPWRQITLQNGLNQWDQNRPGIQPNLMALNSDLYLIRDFNVDDNGRATNNGCRTNFNRCDDAQTLPIVELFTTNQGENVFQQEFKEVYTRMLRSAGQGFSQDLRLICEIYDCSREAPVNPITTTIAVQSTVRPETTQSSTNIISSSSSSTTSTISITDDSNDDLDDDLNNNRNNDNQRPDASISGSSDNTTEAAIGGAVGASAFIILLGFCWFYVVPSCQAKAYNACDCLNSKELDLESPRAPISPKVLHHFAFPAPSAPSPKNEGRRNSYWRNFQPEGTKHVLPTAPTVAHRVAQFQTVENIVQKRTPETQWHYTDSDDNPIGPISDSTFKARIGSQITEETYVWNGESVKEWTFAKNVPELKKAFTLRSRRLPKIPSPPKPLSFVARRQVPSTGSSVSNLIARFNKKNVTEL